MATNSREARRRKIMERGSDRLALITGRIQTLPSSSSSSPDPTTHQDDVTDPPSSQPSITHHQDPQTDLRDRIPVLAPEIEEKPPESDSVVAEQRQRELDRKDDEVVRAIQSEARSSASSSSSTSSLHRVFRANGITGAIESSEKTRISISVLVAMLVVLTHLGFPLLGSQMVKTLLGFRPLYLVLVTNVTLVLVRIFETARPRLTGMSAVLDGIKMPVSDGYEWADRLGRGLQAVLVVKKVLDALFMDCAVYAIVVVCGLSLLHSN